MKPEYDFSKGVRGRLVPEGSYLRSLNNDDLFRITKDERSGVERRTQERRTQHLSTHLGEYERRGNNKDRRRGVYWVDHGYGQWSPDRRRTKDRRKAVSDDA